MGSRWSMGQSRLNDAYRGRWVALDDCRYDTRTAQPVEGSVVDSDEDLVALCNRMQESELSHCAILFCSEEDDAPASARRVASH